MPPIPGHLLPRCAVPILRAFVFYGSLFACATPRPSESGPPHTPSTPVTLLRFGFRPAVSPLGACQSASAAIDSAVEPLFVVRFRPGCRANSISNFAERVSPSSDCLRNASAIFPPPITSSRNAASRNVSKPTSFHSGSPSPASTLCPGASPPAATLCSACAFSVALSALRFPAGRLRATRLFPARPAALLRSPPDSNRFFPSAICPPVPATDSRISFFAEKLRNTPLLRLFRIVLAPSLCLPRSCLRSFPPHALCEPGFSHPFRSPPHAIPQKWPAKNMEGPLRPSCFASHAL